MTRDQSLRMRVLSLMANIFGIQFHVEGLPYGASYERAYPNSHSQGEIRQGAQARQ